MVDDKLDNARMSLELVQNFEVSTLPREAELGQAHNFRAAVEPASKLIRLFQQYPLDFLAELPEQHLDLIRNSADSFYQVLQQILKFDPTTGDPNASRREIIRILGSQYQEHFTNLHPLISYGASRQRDVTALDREFRAVIQGANARAEEIMVALSKHQEEAKSILEEVRRVAAEQGVSQKAYYYAQESSDHEKEAKYWRWGTIGTAGLLIGYVAATAFLHKWPLLAPANTYETVQLALSKALAFIVLAFLLVLCARNFFSHKHNAIVNKHRQNALLTFKALVDAAGSEERRDVILTYAAACIFSPQETGYAKGSSPPPDMPLNIIQALPKLPGGGGAPQ